MWKAWVFVVPSHMNLQNVVGQRGLARSSLLHTRLEPDPENNTPGVVATKMTKTGDIDQVAYDDILRELSARQKLEAANAPASPTRPDTRETAEIVPPKPTQVPGKRGRNPRKSIGEVAPEDEPEVVAAEKEP